ncbi:MAG: hypothetical protein B6242_13980 [Anaerolineaceae bacterium 4572_78]|nr:MAG: hypothetical protein B6242_13980 [Anaerolineaceae bacterium 4572_78]
MTSKKLLITGGSGYLGRYLTRKVAEMHEVYVTYHAHPDKITVGCSYVLNLVDRSQVINLIKQLAPDSIIHAAGINPGGDTDHMMKINRDGSGYIAEGAIEVGAKLVYVSSDVLHDGQNSPYTDDAEPTPLNIYGRSKTAAEKVIQEINPTATIVRTSLIYGFHEMDRSTIGFVERLKSGEKLILFNDVIRQPVWIDTLSTALLKLAVDKTDFCGIINVAGQQPLTREEFGRRMLTWWKIGYHEKISSGKVEDVGYTGPKDVRLIIRKGEKLLNMTFYGVDDVIKICKSKQ